MNKKFGLLGNLPYFFSRMFTEKQGENFFFGALRKDANAIFETLNKLLLDMSKESRHRFTISNIFYHRSTIRTKRHHKWKITSFRNIISPYIVVPNAYLALNNISCFP